VLAAGALCWRPGTDPGDPAGTEVLLVRSARWDEWSWPKGKREPGESLPECAVREVLEETGVRPRLGRALPSVSYALPDGRDKTVSYWAATVSEVDVQTADPQEITEIAWLPVDQARQRLTRPGDLPPLDALMRYAEAGELDTRALLVLRHAKARARANWPGGEGDRPLTSLGRSQANALTGLLAVWAPEQLVSSPWARCMLTLRPYLRARHSADDPYREVQAPDLLTEHGSREDPDRVRQLIRDAVGSAAAGGRLICTHRPVLEVVVDTLAQACSAQAAAALPKANPWLGTGEVLVAHLAGSGRIVMVERWRGALDT